MQVSLIPKEEKEVEEKKTLVNTDVSVEVDSDGWSDPVARKALDEEKTKGVNYVHLQLIRKSSLNGIEESVSVTHNNINPNGLMGSSYGSGGEFDIDNPRSFFDEQLQWKKEIAEEPYKYFTSDGGWKVDYHGEQSFYRLIPINNYVFIISPGLKKRLLEKGFDFDKWYVEYMSINEKLPDKEYEELIDLIRIIMIREYDLVKQSKTIKDSIRYKLGQTKRYNEVIIDLFSDNTIDELLRMLKDKKVEAVNLDQELRTLFSKTRRPHYYSERIINGVEDIDKVISTYG